jgi:hypothetical protein
MKGNQSVQMPNVVDCYCLVANFMCFKKCHILIRNIVNMIQQMGAIVVLLDDKLRRLLKASTFL